MRQLPGLTAKTLTALMACCWLCCAGLSGSAAATDSTGTLRDAHGVRRKYILHFPAKHLTSKPLPLVIVLHGGGQNASIARHITGMNRVADREGFAVLYPNGRGRYRRVLLTWNGGDCCGYSTGRKIDDSGYVADIVDDAVSTGRFDPSRVYVAGFSNGAMLAYKFACEHSDKVAAIASVGGSMTGREQQPKSPVSVLIIHGTKDKHVPYTGGVGKLAKWGYPVNRQSVQFAKTFWLTANHCKKTVSDQRRDIHDERWFKGDNGSEVQILTISGGLHSWPGGKRVLHYGDKPYADLDASAECWRFFQNHSKQPDGLASGHARKPNLIVNNSNKVEEESSKWE
ncbi:MAG: dienelactone hydrolase family protein [Candidatus Obscuribacterales bacterium]|nr:dienelactone hydrolase family protein [Candidatus Obscuribacterales bacterium]